VSYNVAHGGYEIMTTNAVVRARVDEKTKKEAAIVLAAMGFTVSDAFRILLTRVAKDKVFPFEPLIPNKETIAAMKAAREGKLVEVKKIDHLLDSLNEND
jgi:DNA-damage-inducible protein J